MGITQRVRDVVLPIVERDGAELYDIEHESGILRIMVDRQGGIDVDSLGDLSHDISQALDVAGPLPDERYLLEVTSPGIERKLRLPEHFESQIGEEVNIKVRSGVEAEPRRFQARLLAADGDGIEIAFADPNGEATNRRIAYEDIESARTIFHWEDELSPGRTNYRPKKTNAKTTNKKASVR